MDHNPPGCAIASTPPPCSWKKTKKASRLSPGRFLQLPAIRSLVKRELCGRTGAGNDGGYRVDRALPYPEQQHFRASRILKHVVRVRKALHFIKARPAWIWPRGRSRSEKLTQFSDLFLRMVPQIFHEGRLFWNVNHNYVSPPHSAYILLSSKTWKIEKCFIAGNNFSLTNWPPGSIIPGTHSLTL